jgi:hypothetical protein
MRITKADLQGMFNRFLRNIKARKDNGSYDVGSFALDYNACYGGYKVEKIGEFGSTAYPFSNRRLPAREMYEALYMACTALEFVANDKGGEL